MAKPNIQDAEYQDLIRQANELTATANEQSKSLVQELQLLKELMEELGDEDG